MSGCTLQTFVKHYESAISPPFFKEIPILLYSTNCVCVQGGGAFHCFDIFPSVRDFVFFSPYLEKAVMEIHQTKIVDT